MVHLAVHMTHEAFIAWRGWRQHSEDIQTLDQTGLIGWLNLGYGPETPAPGLCSHFVGHIQTLGGGRHLAVQSQMVMCPFLKRSFKVLKFKKVCFSNELHPVFLGASLEVPVAFMGPLPAMEQTQGP